jgi:hypothetical protein
MRRRYRSDGRPVADCAPGCHIFFSFP